MGSYTDDAGRTALTQLTLLEEEVDTALGPAVGPAALPKTTWPAKPGREAVLKLVEAVEVPPPVGTDGAGHGGDPSSPSRMARTKLAGVSSRRTSSKSAPSERARPRANSLNILPLRATCPAP